jgi:hypothetical protein
VLAWSFRGLSLAARNACVTAASRTLVELAARSEFDARRSTAVIGSASPALPLVRYTGCAGFPRRADWAAVKPPSCSSLRAWPFLQSVAQQNPVRGPQPPDASHGLLFPSARAGFGDPLFAGFQARYGPRSGFGHPLRGFRPSNPGRLCFTPAALVGFALRSLLLRRGGRCVSARRTPLAVFLVGKRPARWRGAGPTSRGFWDFFPRPSPSQPAGD